MTRTWDDAAPAVEVCPVCSALDVRAVETGWFVVELDREDELRGAAARPAVQFACRECGTRWD
ncbi:MAG: hypothetical protein ABWY55_09370 [Microbacterium sp.]